MQAKHTKNNMKKYIAPACEMMNLATAEMLAVSFVVDSDKTTSTQLSNSFDNDVDWED